MSAGSPFRRALGIAAASGVSVFAALAALLAAGGPVGENEAAAAPAAAPGLASQLRYLGRDPVTGLPTNVDEQFIAATRRAVERYGKDEQPARAPSPLTAGTIDVRSVVIPSLGVRPAVTRMGVDRYGRLDVPDNNLNVAWYPDFSALPGDDGSTFLAAHFVHAGRPGVFNRLATLRPGDEVVVTLSNGANHRYLVRSTVDYHLGAIDMGAILRGLEGAESLTLMTCSGPPDEGEYAYRTVVLAERVREPA